MAQVLHSGLTFRTSQTVAVNSLAKPDAGDSSSLADGPMREWKLKPIVYEEQSRALLPTVRRSPTWGSSLAAMPGVAPDGDGLQRQDY